MVLFSKYKKKQFIYLFLIFILFIGMIFFSEYKHEKSYRIKALNKELNSYSILINNYISENSLYKKHDFAALDSLIHLFPDTNLRISIIDLSGEVLYDTKVKRISSMENHLMRPEIQKALSETAGTSIRVSSTTGIKYYYFARKYNSRVIRISVVYDIKTKKIIEPDKISLFFILFLFFISSLTLIFITDKFGESISALKRFTIQALKNKFIDDTLTFPENELGIIGQDIVDIYQKLNNTKKELLSEKEKLVHHLNLLEEGIAIFSKDKTLIANNSHFIQFTSLISDQLGYSADDFFTINDFASLFRFIDTYVKEYKTELKNKPSYEITIRKNNKFYTIRCIMFHDKSFEILINDTTKPAKRKLLKQQLTDNIAHELKTPVSSIKGFLETILNSNLDKNKILEFTRKAYSQTCRLNDLINDISSLTKIEEAGSLYRLEKVNLYQIIVSVIDDVQLKLKENSIDLQLNIPENTEFNGNAILLYSIFRNLIDNTINYGGNNLSVRIDKYMEDLQYYYFSFSDTGTGVPEQDLPRLFERFYRVDKGRDRKSGGTGLGLAIVKNAVIYHKGEISAKNRKEGGLEFLFSLNRNLE